MYVCMMNVGGNKLIDCTVQYEWDATAHGCQCRQWNIQSEHLGHFRLLSEFSESTEMAELLRLWNMTTLSRLSQLYSACHVLCKTSDAAQKYISNINTFYFYNFANLLYFVSFICFIVTVYSCLYFSLIYYRLVVLKACLGWLAVYLEVHLLAAFKWSSDI